MWSSNETRIIHRDVVIVENCRYLFLDWVMSIIDGVRLRVWPVTTLDRVGLQVHRSTTLLDHHIIIHDVMMRLCVGTPLVICKGMVHLGLLRLFITSRMYLWWWTLSRHSPFLLCLRIVSCSAKSRQATAQMSYSGFWLIQDPLRKSQYSSQLSSAHMGELRTGGPCFDSTKVNQCSMVWKHEMFLALRMRSSQTHRVRQFHCQHSTAVLCYVVTRAYILVL